MKSSNDGFRVIARKDGTRVKLYSRPGNDLTDRFSLIAREKADIPSSVPSCRRVSVNECGSVSRQMRNRYQHGYPGNVMCSR